MYKRCQLTHLFSQFEYYFFLIPHSQAPGIITVSSAGGFEYQHLLTELCVRYVTFPVETLTSLYVVDMFSVNLDLIGWRMQRADLVTSVPNAVVKTLSHFLTNK